MSNARVTIVTVPREMFTPSRRSLESVYAHATMPFELVYVDGGSPTRIRRWIDSQRATRGFDLVRTDRYLSPNEARNLGLERVKTEYVVFLDNDVIVSPGWLERMVECADETGAAAVTPLTFEGEPEDEMIHFAGGEVQILVEEGDGSGPQRRVKEKIHHGQRRLSKVSDQLRREQVSLVEFHCALVRTSLFAEIGTFDEGLLNTREHLDFCLRIAAAGGETWFEPASVVSYTHAAPSSLSDVRFYMLRWSDDWERRSLTHFRAKWDLADDDFFRRRLERVGWRRQQALIKPLSERLTFGRRGSGKVAQAIKPPERALNRYLTGRDRRERQKAAV